MTQSQYDQLPLNLRPAQARAVLGVGKEGLRTLRELHPQIAVRQCGKGQWIYSKSEVGKLARLKG